MVDTVDFCHVGRLSLGSVPLMPFPVSGADHRAVGACTELMPLGHFRFWLHKQRDPLSVSCIHFMVTLHGCNLHEKYSYSTALDARELWHYISPGLIKGSNEEHALLMGVCVGYLNR